MREDTELARFQALLLELLASELPAEEIRTRLMAHDDARPFADYVAGFDLRCVEVAGRITRKFARRKGDDLEANAAPTSRGPTAPGEG